MNRLATVTVAGAALVLGWYLFGAQPRTSRAAGEGGGPRAPANRGAEDGLDARSTPPAARAVGDATGGETERDERPGSSVATSPVGPTLEVLVTYDETPLAGAEVSAVPFEDFSEFLVDTSAPAAIARATTDASGLAALDLRDSAAIGLAVSGPGGSGARAPGGSGARARIVPPAGPARARVGVALGSASVEGVVRGLDGSLVANVRVIAHQRGPDVENQGDGEQGVWFATRTDASGNYRLAGLAGGRGRTVLALVLDLPLGESLPFELATGEAKRLDFGSAAGRATWSGTLRSPSGAEIPGPDRIVFVAQSDATCTQGSIDERGRFVAHLPAGAYTARLGSASGAILGTAEVVGSIEQDLLAPWVFLHGRIRYVGTKHAVPRGPENEVTLELERVDGKPVSAGLLRGASTYGFVGVEPGAYVLSAKPWVLDEAAEGRMRIEIVSERNELELDLSITDP